jgi:hypothetical protein
VYVYFNGTYLGDIFATGAHRCRSTPDQEDILLTAEYFNGLVAGGDAEVLLCTDPGVDPAACDPSSIRMVISYPTAPTSDDLNENDIPDECEREPDHLHVVGPMPNDVVVGQAGRIEAVVLSEFLAVPGREVVFAKLLGDFEFTSGDVSGDGTESSMTTDADGRADVTFAASGIGSCAVRVTVADHESLVAYSVFRIVNGGSSSHRGRKSLGVEQQAPTLDAQLRP